MADNLKILKGSIDKMPASVTEGQIYFATSLDKEDGKLYKGKIFVDIDPDTRISFGEHADTAISDASGNEIISTYLHHLSITDIDFDGNPSEENLYLRGFTPTNVQVPGLDQSDWPNYTLPAANANTPGLLSLTTQSIYGDKTFVDNIYFANSENYYIDNTALGKIKGLTIEDPDADQNFLLSVKGFGNVDGYFEISNTADLSTNNGLEQATSIGAFNAEHINLGLRGDSTGTSGILFTSSKRDGYEAHSDIGLGKDDDEAFIQFYARGIDKGALGGSGTTPNIKNSGHNSLFVIGIGGSGDDGTGNGDEVWIQTPGSKGLFHYSMEGGIATIWDSVNFSHLKFNTTASTTKYNQNGSIFDFSGQEEIEIYAGNAYQDMSNTVADSTVSSGINADKLNGYTYLNIAAEMILSNDEISEIIG